MTDKEKAIVMAYTGICMLTGDKFQIFHKYIEDIMGRPIWTDDIGWLEDEIKEKSKADFIALCANDNNSENSNRWIPVSERLPESDEDVLVTNGIGMYIGWIDATDKVWRVGYESGYSMNDILAWMPLPEHYKAESEK